MKVHININFDKIDYEIENNYSINLMSGLGLMNAVYRSERTWNGWSLDVAKSGMQKYIRRGNLAKSLYFMFELDLFAFLDESRAEGIRTNMIHRLMIIYMEDIGIANADIWPRVSTLIFSLLSLREGRKTEGVYSENRRKEALALIEIVYMLSTSMKGRECSFYKYAWIVYTECNHYMRILDDVPGELERDFSTDIRYEFKTGDEEARPYALKFMGALEKGSPACLYFANKICGMKVGKHMNSIKPPYMIFDLMKAYFSKYKNAYLEERLNVAIRWYKELSGIKEDFLPWAMMCIMILRKDTLQRNTVDEVDAKTLMPMVKMNILNLPIEVDEWVFDMHTKEGKRRGKGAEHFADVSSVVENEDPGVIKVYKDAYIRSKKGLFDRRGEWPESESELEVEIRAQLVTANHHTDTYFARVGGERVFVKGPFVKEEMVDFLVWMSNMKKGMGIPSIECKKVMMYPDGMESALGMRNRTDRGRKYAYAVYESKLKGDIPEEVRSSKMWPDTRVVDWSKVSECRKPNLKDKAERRGYVEALVFRALMGIGDNAMRNFMWAEGVVYSIDEDTVGEYNFKGSREEERAVEEEINRNVEYYIEYMKKVAEKLKVDVEGKGVKEVVLGKEKVKSVFRTPDIGEHKGSMKTLEELWGKK